MQALLNEHRGWLVVALVAAGILSYLYSKRQAIGGAIGWLASGSAPDDKAAYAAVKTLQAYFKAVGCANGERLSSEAGKCLFDHGTHTEGGA